MNDDCGSHNWFAVEVRNSREKVVSEHLQAKGLEAFVPTYEEPRQWSACQYRLKIPHSAGRKFPSPGRWWFTVSAGGWK